MPYCHSISMNQYIKRQIEYEEMLVVLQQNAKTSDIVRRQRDRMLCDMEGLN
jgi:hypothetical protein